MPKKGSGGQPQPWQINQQQQLPGQMPSYGQQQTQPVGQPQPVPGQMPHIPQAYGDGGAVYTGNNPLFQRFAQQRAQGGHPLFNMIFQHWGQ